MNKIELLNKYYSKESALEILSSYVLYYQISLGNFTFETIQNQEKSILKLKDLNLTLTPNDILISAYTLLLFETKENTVNSDFNERLQKKAILHALNDFVSNNTELENKNLYLQLKHKEIIENKFFTTKMKMNYLEQYPDMYSYYKDIITDDYMNTVKDVIKKNFLS